MQSETSTVTSICAPNARLTISARVVTMTTLPPQAEGAAVIAVLAARGWPHVRATGHDFTGFSYPSAYGAGLLGPDLTQLR